MSVVNSIMMSYYTMMMNNSAYSMMMGANSRMNLLGSASQNGTPESGMAFRALTAKDTELELQMAKDSFNYRYSKAMLEKLKKQQKSEKQGLDVIA